uniref:Uncharacterized protein n=1 Tax=Lotharella globosa TaxID=91324 RepID=A0A7S4DX79_9EUKA
MGAQEPAPSSMVLDLGQAGFSSSASIARLLGLVQDLRMIRQPPSLEAVAVALLLRHMPKRGDFCNLVMADIKASARQFHVDHLEDCFRLNVKARKILADKLTRMGCQADHILRLIEEPLEHYRRDPMTSTRNPTTPRPLIKQRIYPSAIRNNRRLVFVPEDVA